MKKNFILLSFFSANLTVKDSLRLGIPCRYFAFVTKGFSFLKNNSGSELTVNLVFHGVKINYFYNSFICPQFDV